MFLTSVLISCEEKQPPNIVFIMSDDHAYQAISAYGHGLNETPNIDRIAKEGALFKKGFVTNSICAPSRAVMLTGKHSFINGKVDNIQDYNWDQDNFAKQLQTVGYQTAMVGKIHLRGLPQGFDYSAVLPGQGHYYNPDFIIDGIKNRIKGYYFINPVKTRGKRVISQTSREGPTSSNGGYSSYENSKANFAINISKYEKENLSLIHI